ncbi:MAG: hypothetical protein BHW09_00470 [Clostridium sp. CAG:245_30_32]|nr:MAG: hypothetical protein BHW09_00470 [Clostridium sp. CAG:245_30_32]
MNVLERKRGITLIALVITIITILILAGVSINSIIGKNGIVERAQTTGKIQTVASIKEALELEKGDLLVNSKTVNLNNYLDQISNGDKKYEISSKEIIDDKNAEIIVDDKYKFALKDTEEGDVEVTYQGVAASSDLSISAKSGTYVYPNSGTFTVTNNVSGGELTVSSDAINIATATIEGNTVTVVPGTTAGKANIIVKSSANGDYAENKVVHVATVQNGTIELSVTPYTGIYDGKAHDAITKINVNPTDAKIEYSIDGENYSETVPTITETSSFTVTVRASKAGYKTQITTETVKVNKAKGKLTLSATSGTLTYPTSGMFTVSGNTGTLSVASSNTNIATASINGSTVTVKPGTTAGKATITVTSAEASNYNEKSATYEATVQNGTISLSATPYTGTYDGKAHNAYTSVNVTPSDAKLEYSINGGTYSTTMPTITNTSSFTVTVKASKAGYKTQIKTETVRVNKAAGTLTLSATSGTLTYPTNATFTVSGNKGNLSVASSNTNIATASISGNTVTVKPGTTAGKATITVTSAEASNYNEKSATYTATVNNGTISLSATPYTGTYDGKAHNAVTKVTVTYSTDGKTYSTTMPTITNTSSFTVTVRASKAGYKTQTTTQTVKVNKAAGTLTLSATSGTLTYPTNATFTASGNKGTLSVASSNTNIATASISGSTVTVKPGTTAGKATITVTSAATTNYNQKSATYTATVNNGTISLSATPYTGTYDGKAHNAITKVTYSTDGKTYSTTMPTITNTSSFTVTVRASKAGYKTQSTTQTVKVGGQIVIGTIKVVENSNGSGTAIAANGALTGKDLYITFSHSIASGSTSVSPSLPYKVTKNGTYTFTVTGTSNGITSKKTVSVTVNQYMSSSTGSNPYLPGNDFKKVDGTDLSNGLVIEDKDGSQYVWIEVPKTSTVYPTAGTNITNFDSAAYTKITADLENYTKAYKSGGYSDADDDAKHVMLKSVYENGGFYIGRFEEGTANAEESTTEGTSAGPVSKINMYPYRLLTLPEAMDLTKKVNAGNRTCTLMYEVQWNLVLAHLHNKGNISDTVLTQNSDSIGNTSSVSFTLNRGKYYANNNRGWQAYNVDYYNEDDEYYLVKSKVKQKHAALLTTGAADRNKVMNIYDFAGNVAEWTIGVYSSTHWPCVVRGNSYNSGSNAAYHGDAAWYDYDGNIGFRVSIY